jgi:uncharacterized protein YbaR (Trm112 family)
MPIRQELLDILVCPKCKGRLETVTEPVGFACPACRLLFKIEDEIPNFLLDEALPWNLDAPSVK